MKRGITFLSVIALLSLGLFIGFSNTGDQPNGSRSGISSFDTPPVVNINPFSALKFSDSLNGANDTTALKNRGYKTYYRGTGPQGLTATWFQPAAAPPFPAFNGPTTGYAAANFNVVTGTNNIDSWLVLPALNIATGDTLSFYTNSTGSTWVDSVTVSYSAAGDSVPEAGSWVQLGKFKVNAGWALNNYMAPAGGSNARFAIRYKVVNGGPNGANSDYMGVDMITVRGSVAPPVGGSVTMCRNGLNTAIPDNQPGNPARDSIVLSGIPAGNVIKKITVKIDTVNHTWIGDLIFWLTKSNVTDTIISRVGLGSGPFPLAGNSCDNFRGTNLRDSVGAPPVQGIPDCGTPTGGLAATTGTFNPKSPLSVFANNSIDPNGSYVLRISDNAAADLGNLRAWCITVEYGAPTGIVSDPGVVDTYQLSQNYPNPFNPTTKIDFALPKSGLVTLKVYDMVGKEVATLVNGVQTAGNHTVDFNASFLSSGVYFYRLEAGDFKQVKRMMLVK